jgi:hemerythrin-like domain-containing protein
MKRAEALRPLSREHLVALTVAKNLRATADPAAARAEFLDFWREDGRDHFRVEEEVLLPVWALHAEVEREGVIRMLDEHREIRKEALRLQVGEATVEQLRSLGVLLHNHVRFEERELFPLVEADLDADAVLQLAEEIEGATA